MQRGLAVAAAVAALGGSAAQGGSYSVPLGDRSPEWSHDGSAIRFHAALRGVIVMAPAGTAQRRLEALPAFGSVSFSPRWRWVAHVDPRSDELIVSTPEGGERRVIVRDTRVTGVSWAPGEDRLAFTDDGGLSVVDIATGAVRRLAGQAFDPAWSTDGTRIAYGVGTGRRARLLTIPSEGGSTRQLAAGSPSGRFQPVWEPSGSRLLVTSSSFQSATVRIFGSGRPSARRLASPPFLSIVWDRGRNALLASGEGVYRVSLSNGRVTRLSSFGQDARLSPDGTTIAFAAGGECKDRTGIYRMPAAGGTAVRLTNSCRIIGTAGDDELHGTDLADVLLGLDGADVLHARDQSYQGDDLLGGAGPDRLVGGALDNRLRGGPGNDGLEGGRGWDTLDGGPGVDRLSGGGARDFLVAVDGERDYVSCGTSLGPTTDFGLELDVAYVDPADRVARDCEFVHRAPRASPGRTVLTITDWPRGRRFAAVHGTIACSRRPQLCARLVRLPSPFGPPRPMALCGAYRKEYWRVAYVSGLYRGRRVSEWFVRTSPCEAERYDRLRFLFRGLR